MSLQPPIRRAARLEGLFQPEPTGSERDVMMICDSRPAVGQVNFERNNVSWVTFGKNLCDRRILFVHFKVFCVITSVVSLQANHSQ